MIEFELPDFAEITPDGYKMLLEKTVKHNGIWRIHKNDPDNIFPSDPHADRQDAPEKLDLYNGNVYDKKTKEHIYSLPKKAMKYIYQEIMKCKEDIIKNKLINNKAAITYL
jgi:hypothetical protein